MSKQMKIFAIVTITLLLAILVVQLFIKDKIVLEDSAGNDLAGFSGKIGVTTEDLDKLSA